MTIKILIAKDKSMMVLTTDEVLKRITSLIDKLDSEDDVIVISSDEYVFDIDSQKKLLEIQGKTLDSTDDRKYEVVDSIDDSNKQTVTRPVDKES